MNSGIPKCTETVYRVMAATVSRDWGILSYRDISREVDVGPQTVAKAVRHLIDSGRIRRHDLRKAHGGYVYVTEERYKADMALKEGGSTGGDAHASFILAAVQELRQELEAALDRNDANALVSLLRNVSYELGNDLFGHFPDDRRWMRENGWRPPMPVGHPLEFHYLERLLG